MSLCNCDCKPKRLWGKSQNETVVCGDDSNSSSGSRSLSVFYPRTLSHSCSEMLKLVETIPEIVFPLVVGVPILSKKLKNMITVVFQHGCHLKWYESVFELNFYGRILF